MVADHDEIALGGYGDAVDLAVKVPTLPGIIVALISATVVFAWRQLRRRLRAT
jgi:hypothetical protein